jgi:CubicO group peptidase (beta-lactamase class C family)
VRTEGTAVLVEAPEEGSRIAVIDVDARTVESALAEAWAAYQPRASRELQTSTAEPDVDGWQDVRSYAYVTSPNEQRAVNARTMRRGERWTVRIYDVANAVAGKRSAQISLIVDELLPAGYTRESFAGRTAHRLDATRITEIGAFIERARQALGVPGVSIGLVQNGKVVFAGGFGVRELGKPAKVDADTKYLIASNTKPLTTLMLAKLVDEHKLTWDTPAVSLLDTFKLGDDTTTQQVLVKHLLCACTGVPRQDLFWILERRTPARAIEWLGHMKVTSKLGEIYQYSNPVAAAAGFVGGHVAFPALELGAAYDRAMQTRVFGPLGMTSTTFDFARARRGNYARGHTIDIDGKPAFALTAAPEGIFGLRPAGGAWSTVHDLLQYVQMETANGVLPDGSRYISEAALAARAAPQIVVGPHITYGMGVEVETTYGTPVANHGGRMFGYRSNVLWLPEHGVGAVLLTNSDTGNAIMPAFTRKILEVLFDGAPQADRDIAAAATALQQRAMASRARLTVPPESDEIARLASHYTSPDLGALRVRTAGGDTVFDFGDGLQSPVASRKNPDGSVSFITSAPGFWRELVVGAAGGRRTLLTREDQHEYVFTED